MPSSRNVEPSSYGRFTAPDERSFETVIEAHGVTKYFTIGSGIVTSLLGKRLRQVRAVDGVDLAIGRSEILGLVGGSGSGKSTLAMTLVRLHQPSAGTITFHGRSITDLKGAGLKTYRRDAQMIFQDPYSSLNPRLTVAQIVEEPLRIHGVRDRNERGTKVIQALERVRIPASEYLDRYPHELSGGLRQRIAIARAIVLEPEFIVADEPVSMLDVSIQAGVLQLLERLSRELGLAILYVSHDIATVRYICDRVAVMHLGEFVEYGNTDKVTAQPEHPYTKRLMAAVPSVDRTTERQAIRTSSASAVDAKTCARQEPHWDEVEPDHYVACHLH